MTSTVNIGIDEAQRAQIADGLSKLLADTYALYTETQGFHWNVTGSDFAQLHTLFETQYGELAEAIDEIAERVRALGFKAPAGFKRFAELASFEAANDTLDATSMVRVLLTHNEAVAATARAAVEAVEGAHDIGTADLLTRRLLVHDKNAWMLRSLLA